jgi:peptide/nickel transport system substrate-binding protein
MDEQELRALIADVKRGRLSRRGFVRSMVGLGLSAPMAAQMLASAGVVSAQPRETGPAPTRRGGGGDLKVLMWDAPGLLNPHFGRGLKDLTATRLFYEPLAAAGPDGELFPVLAEELPSRKNGSVAKDGKWVIWRLKRNVFWHDGRPFTADDVVFNWEFAADPATAATSRGPFREVAQVDKLDSHTVKVVYKKPQPYWGAAFGGDALIPRHVFGAHKGSGAREAAGMLKPVGTGPYRLVDFTPGDFIRAELNPSYHVPNRPYFDRVDIKGGGDAVSAARAVLQTGEYDFAYYVLAEEDVLKRLEQGGAKGRILAIPSSGVNHIQCNQSDPWREVDGERSSGKSTHPSLGDHALRKAISLLVDRASIQEHIVGRNGQITSNFLNAPERFRSRNTSWEFSVERANQILDELGWARGPDGVRAKDGKRLKFLFQAATASSVQKVQAVVKQAAARAGIEIEVKAIPASVFFSADPNNVDTNVRFHADLQMYTTFTWLDPQFFMSQFCSWELPTRENKWSGRNITRWRSAEYDRLWREAEVEMDPVKRAALFIHMNDLVIQSGVEIPVTWRNVLHAVSNQIVGVQPNSWDSIFGSIAYWSRQS